MNQRGLSKKSIIILIVWGIAFVFVMTHIVREEIKNRQPVELNLDYLNSQFDVGFDQLLYTEDKLEGDAVICLLRTTGDKLCATYLEKRGEGKYMTQMWDVIGVDKISDQPSAYNQFVPLSYRSTYENKTIYYSIFTNPQMETVTVSGNSIEVHKINVELQGTEYNFGFWCCILDSDEPVEISW